LIRTPTRVRPAAWLYTPLAVVDPDRARDAAREILKDSSFDPADPPRPLEGVGNAIARLLEPVERFLDRVSDAMPGGGRSLWLILAIAVVLSAIFVAVRMSRWLPAPVGGESGSTAATVKSLDRLEAAAEEARRSGDLRNEIRFRFQAGLLRLARAGALPGDASLTTGQVARALRSETFDRLARSFDEVVYGGRQSMPADAELSRNGWRDLLSGRAR
jgi:Domain of unknown function (DUF4129)